MLQQPQDINVLAKESDSEFPARIAALTQPQRDLLTGLCANPSVVERSRIFLWQAKPEQHKLIKQMAKSGFLFWKPEHGYSLGMFQKFKDLKAILIP